LSFLKLMPDYVPEFNLHANEYTLDQQILNVLKVI